jgi:hypothetical protein
VRYPLLHITSFDPLIGSYDYEPTSDADAKAVRETLRALGATVTTERGE